LIDPFDGRNDASQGVIRAVADNVFSDDPLRLLRAVRQAAELGFRIDESTLVLIRRDASLLTSVAAERMRDELVRILALPSSWHFLAVMQETGLLIQVLPEVAFLVGIAQSAPHYQDVFDHSRSVLAHLESIRQLIWMPDVPNPPGWQMSGDTLKALDDDGWADLTAVIRPYQAELQAHLAMPVSAGLSRWGCVTWAALAHDWGKPATGSVDASGKIRFLEHEKWGAVLAQARMTALRMSSDETARISRLVGLHMRPGYLSHDYPPSHRAVYRFFRGAADCGPDCVVLSLADHAAIRSGNRFAESWERQVQTASLLLEVYFRERSRRVDPVPLLNGRQLISIFGLEEGPQVGALLESLREAQAIGEVTCHQEALAWIAERVNKGGG
jgi:tRNA nucleotidyltransferase/poly(A) polymerase